VGIVAARIAGPQLFANHDGSEAKAVSRRKITVEVGARRAGGQHTLVTDGPLHVSDVPPKQLDLSRSVPQSGGPP